MISRFVFSLVFVLGACAPTPHEETSSTFFSPQEYGEEGDSLSLPDTLDQLGGKKVVWHRKDEEIAMTNEELVQIWANRGSQILLRLPRSYGELELSNNRMRTGPIFRGLGGPWEDGEVHLFETDWDGDREVYIHDGQLLTFRGAHTRVLIDLEQPTAQADWARSVPMSPRVALTAYVVIPEIDFQLEYKAMLHSRGAKNEIR